ncbi:alpha/beta fold hydrolase [Nocardia anaemiae]|uniref:alpha/beta fold hydrolase n=1 Tax=Nocardia anaemiae TaxID=263910 RepID=UPI0007A533E9|nr:alpha/beta hydrolase [Nocardia anaemiae]
MLTYHGSDGRPLHVTVVGADKPPLILLHAGGPDHRSLLPLATRLADRYTVLLPDLRGYGRSICTDPALHTWACYTDDVISLAEQFGLPRVAIGGAGLGSTITLRTAAAHPELVTAAILIGVEDIEDDEAKTAEIEFLDAFATRVATDGIEAAWAPILSEMPPLVADMVHDAIPRSDPASIVAAAAIGHDRSFRDVAELATITAPTLIFPGTDARHPTALAETAAATMPRASLASVSVSYDLHTADDLAEAIAPEIRTFLAQFA